MEKIKYFSTIVLEQQNIKDDLILSLNKEQITLQHLEDVLDQNKMLILDRDYNIISTDVNVKFIFNVDVDNTAKTLNIKFEVSEVFGIIKIYDKINDKDLDINLSDFDFEYISVDLALSNEIHVDDIEINFREKTIILI